MKERNGKKERMNSIGKLTSHQEKRTPLVPADLCARVGKVREGAELGRRLPGLGGELEYWCEVACCERVEEEYRGGLYRVSERDDQPACGCCLEAGGHFSYNWGFGVEGVGFWGLRGGRV